MVQPQAPGAPPSRRAGEGRSCYPPTAVRIADASGTSLPPATSRIHKQPEAVDEPTWWRTEGEPAIVTFRDCIAAFTGREAQRRPETSLGDLVIEAGAGDCRARFEEMMTTLTVRYGRERLETAMGPILNEILLPAARAAAEDAARTAAGSTAIP